MVTIDATTKFYFIGVTTSASSIRQIFPRWMEELGSPEVALVGVDHALHDRPEAYRQTVRRIKDDPLAAGGLVTSHKIDLYNAAADLFDQLDDYAKTCGEVSCISKTDGLLVGGAVDPITSAISLDGILGGGYFGRSGGEALCFGAGGAGAAIALALIGKPDADDRPGRFLAVDVDPARLDRLRGMVEGQATGIRFEYIHHLDPHLNDSLLGSLPSGSLVINATGMGKDTPGTPVSGRGVFPEKGVIWELNYRGELDFYRQALAQRAQRELLVEDGWTYFLHGWTLIVGTVLELDITPQIFERLSQIAGPFRPT